MRHAEVGPVLPPRAAEAHALMCAAFLCSSIAIMIEPKTYSAPEGKQLTTWSDEASSGHACACRGRAGGGSSQFVPGK